MKKIIVTVVLVATTLWGVSAQRGASVTKKTIEVTGVLVLNLDQALEIALSDNPTIKIAGLEIERQDWVRKQTVGNLLPTVSVGGQYSYSIVKQEMAEGLSFGSDHSIGGAASLSVPLFAPTVYQMLKMNDTQMEQAVESARKSKITLVNEVKKSFYNILLAKQSLETLLQSESTIEETVNNTKAMFENGLASEYDYLSAQVQLSNLKPTIIQTELLINTAQRMFKMYLGLPNDVNFELEGTLNDFVSEILKNNFNYSANPTNNTDLRNLEFQERLLQHQLKINKAQHLPTIAAVGNFNLAGSNSSMNINTGATLNEWWWQNPMDFGVQISIPIFQGNKVRNKSKEIRNTISQLSIQKDYLEQSVMVQIQNSISAIYTARESMYSNQITVGQAQKAYNISVVRYNSGSGTILELNSSELLLTQAKLNYSQAIYDYLASQADYYKALGNDFLPEDEEENKQ